MLALAARTMRRILIDEARKAGAAKRHAPTLMTMWPGSASSVIDLSDLDEALSALHAYSDDHATIVEMRFTLGLTVDETARQTGIPERTIKRRWQVARAWLHDYLQAGDNVRAG